MSFAFGKKIKNHKCHGCEKRFVGCHASCEIYQGIKNVNDAYREAINKDSEMNHILKERKTDGIKRVYGKVGVKNG